VGDDALSPPGLDRELVAEVRDRYRAAHGDHPMTAADEAHVREHLVPVPSDAVLRLVLDGLLPLPSYLLPDGTPMVPSDHGEPARIAGGAERLHDWFVAFWPDEPGVGERSWRDYVDGRFWELRTVTPVRVRQVASRIAQAQRAIEVVRHQPHDPVGRGLLGEAVDGAVAVIGLDDLLLPSTPYDRLRLGGPTLRDTWVDAPRREHLSPAPPALPIRSERLVLRPFRAGDESAFREGWGSEAWTSLLLSPPMNDAEVADWVRRRAEPGDATVLGLVVEHDGEVVGDSLLMLQGVGLAHGEIGWTVLPRHAGRGYATEAARAVLEVAFEHYGLHRVVANLDARNERSAALCERLGMRREVHRLADFWSKGTWTDSLEYALLADEWRARR